MTNTNFTKLEEIKKALNAKFFERKDEVEGILVALLSRQHMLMIGPAGTAKSALSVELAKIVQGTNYFQWLLTRFSTPEEVFGPLSLKDLEQGVYKRNTATKMPEANLVFLDEIFKANSAILNSLLTLINERLFYNNGTPVKVPLMSVIGASNEYPEEGEGLEALFDRFLLRFELDYIADETNFVSMMKGTGQNFVMPSMTMDELVQLQFFTDMVTIPDEVYDTLSKIRNELRDEGIRPSDRRFKQSLSVLQAKALINQRQVVKVDDIVILENALWETVDQKDNVSLIVRSHAQDVVTQKLDRVQEEASEIYSLIQKDASTDAGMEATQKLKSLVADLNKLKKHNQSRDGDIDPLLDKVKAIQQEVLDSILEPMDIDTSSTKSAVEMPF
ncbi:ATPase [Sporosarcina sp. P12(2017)]|uniref:AAA family ATPase n=1 Tax=unclassified Sporosarcina TaxID=2647733 RepID=UPI000C165AF4|nr:MULTISPECIES: AAA family ATPase [unclassified Sporosarcina]PIC56951.1 ATPase [Sporosarcina sp. P10]PIC60334.1 ATPase [Sporosarcina sp. P12(2017)]PIC69547.1 ATPase [Sporosarcina sp. P16b]